ncbi:hypothetical protein [Actinomadura geliboluensis]|uniref:Uncharacterized protein n=1 Tax=Actinomadura geliboluensis TaxID=882440 RepID=A0A5S4H4T9_9ACTN|nr:hypothetical protein [Actinomadura geliboluensis]TMR40243.1 hypothetical protein ETD96_11720 [Actinomadura geliboluensis]
MSPARIRELLQVLSVGDAPEALAALAQLVEAQAISAVPILDEGDLEVALDEAARRLAERNGLQVPMGSATREPVLDQLPPLDLIAARSQEPDGWF